MYAYCNNNPSNSIDSTGNFPAAAVAAVVGGAIGGALVSLMSYLGSNDSPTFGGGLVAVAAGGISGAIGGMTVVYSSGVQLALCVLGAGTISGLYTEYDSGSFLTGFASGCLGTWFGSLFDLKMLSGFDLGAASYFFTTFTGFCAEMGVTLAQEVFKEEPAPQNNTNNSQTTAPVFGGAGGVRSIGTKPVSMAMLY